MPTDDDSPATEIKYRAWWQTEALRERRQLSEVTLLEELDGILDEQLTLGDRDSQLTLIPASRDDAER